MKNKKSHIWAALVVIAVFLLIAIFGCGSDIKGIREMRFGIDIRGGVEAVFEPVGNEKKPEKEELESARNVIEQRLDSKNILDREVTVDTKEGRIIVRFPWKSDEKTFNPEDAIAELGETAKLTFQDENHRVLVEGQNVSDSRVVQNPENRQYEVELHFDDAGSKAFAAATKANVGKKIGIYMDESLISNPVVQQEIQGGEAVINGMGSRDEAKALSDKIQAGALPFSMKTSNYNTISPTLGNQALQSMAAAAAVALVLVCLFMVCFYRLPGVLSCITLLFQMALQILAISVPQYTITLPGIAGLILSAGMAVDANIIISERISEELRDGLSVKAAVKKGYQRAFSSVLDGNVTTAAVAAILMIFGSGTMLSFGYTLFTGVIINLFAGVWVSRTMLNSVVQYTFFDKPSMFRKKKKLRILNFSGKRRWIFLFTLFILLTGTAASAVNGMKLDTQFTGGVILKYTFEGQADTEDLRKAVEHVTGRPANIQTVTDPNGGKQELAVTLAGNKGLSPEDQKAIAQELNHSGQGEKFHPSESYAVEPYIGAKALRNSVIAIILSAVFIVIYIRIRFSAMSGLAAGISAVIALLHDILIVTFVFGVFRIPINDAFVAVTLTIIGYSINDTIVLYDRIRENQKSAKKKESLARLVDRSITETLGRSVNTAFTVVLCVFTVFLFSLIFRIESIRVFSLPLLAGMISGCYSSVCIAGPLWVWWEEHRQKSGRGKKVVQR